MSGAITNEIKWNFTSECCWLSLLVHGALTLLPLAEFLCDRNGVPVGRFSPTTDPHSLEADIERLLDELPFPGAGGSTAGAETAGGAGGAAADGRHRGSFAATEAEEAGAAGAEFDVGDMKTCAPTSAAPTPMTEAEEAAAAGPKFDVGDMQKCAPSR